ncbi:hypothetical protein JCM11251_001798 [Rhodosporidiobolus azoricus]
MPVCAPPNHARGGGNLGGTVVELFGALRSLPFVGFVSLPALVACSALLVYLIPLTLHLLFSQPYSYQPPLFPVLPPFSLSKSARLTFHTLRLLYDTWRAHIPLLFFDGLAKRVLLLGGKDGGKIVKENVVYLEACPPLYSEAKRLDIYYPSPSFGGEDELAHVPAPIILLLPSPTYRLFPSLRSFPAPHIALRLARLGALVVIPSLSSYHGRMEDGECIERMVAEVREVIKWAGENGARYGGDVEKVWVIGHGAGAHVGLLTVIQSAVVTARDAYLIRLASEGEQRKVKEGKVTTDEGRVGQDSDSSILSDGDSFFSRTSQGRPVAERSTHESNAGAEDDEGLNDVPSVNVPSGVLSAQLWTLDSLPSRCSAASFSSTSYEASSHVPSGGAEPEERGESISSFTVPLGRGRSGGRKRVRVRGMVLSGAMYDVAQQMKTEEKIGMSEVSSLTRVCGSPGRDILQACPSHLLFASLPLLSTMSPATLAQLLPENFLLSHGGADPSVPYGQAVLFKNLLAVAGLGGEGGQGEGGKAGGGGMVKLRLYRGESGIGGLASLMSQTKYSPLVMRELEEAIFRDEREEGEGGKKSCRAALGTD